MSICHKVCMMPTIMFDITNKMDTDVLAVIGNWCLMAVILEDLAFFHQIQFKVGGILPQGVAIFLVKADCISAVSWNFHTTFAFGLAEVFPDLGLVCNGEEISLFLGGAFEAVPTWFVKQSLLSCMDGTCHWCINSHDGKWFICCLPIFPFNSHIVG